MPFWGCPHTHTNVNYTKFKRGKRDKQATDLPKGAQRKKKKTNTRFSKE